MELVIKYKKLFAFTFWIWIVIIITFSVIPNGPKMEINFKNSVYRLDYLLHFLIYFSLAILYLLWKADKYFKLKSNLLLYFLIGGLALAGLSEYAQSIIPGRTFNPLDFYSNTSGIIVGIITPKLIFR